ncbi:MAG: acetylornithine/succinylornithine family transaminase [Treponema sp.]|nr:acetylornithine/succinylornithine family transaminase [Spirochaetia bacterium]MCI5608452.1 acetylornithine/succinylornithine family transaminase [Spirochaetia bacterium]MDD6654494.1 acetylornithine/succinylornithine family transaminase [Treponema sp.]MDY5763165.1 acetylornithine/succinylornithine family transaminase [Treponema sp.]
MEKLIVNNYGSFDITFTKGKNATLWDSKNKKYIDFIAGIGVNSLGHNNKALVKAISKQAKKQIHISNYYFSDTGLSYSKKLLKELNFDHGYFGNSGAEANEAAIKLARKYGELNGGSKRKTIITLESSFHGRTLATLTATGQNKFHPECFAPYPEGFKTIKANDFESLENAFDDTCAALFMESIQGEGGVNLIDKEWALAACEKARKAGAIVMIDEVQTGIGRTGSFLYSDSLGLNAEVVTLAKGIAGGLPMGACLFRGKAKDVFKAGDHQSTFAGNPLVCAAAEVVLETVNKNKFLQNVTEKGDYIRNTIKAWNFPFVKDVRGKGLMIGIQIESTIKPFDIEVKCLEEGLCTTTAGNDVVRFLPPLTISKKEIDEGLEIFKKVLKTF